MEDFLTPFLFLLDAAVPEDGNSTLVSTCFIFFLIEFELDSLPFAIESLSLSLSLSITGFEGVNCDRVYDEVPMARNCR